MNIKRFTKNQEVQICNEYFSEKKPGIISLAEKQNCSYTAINNIINRNGYDLRTRREAAKGKHRYWYGKHRSEVTKQKISKSASTPEAIQRTLRNGYGKKCYYNGEFFPSLGERDCYIIFIDLGYAVIHNFLDRFDFLLILSNKEKVVVEYHPYNFNLTNKQYYNQRRKLLNEYGYKDLKLIVIKELNEIKKIKGFL